ncbi:hypothetical protein N7540_012989 [Penicillium herquei]|nr:hypothetical protein N7540_012989 [Penicillium herquei]
MLHHQNVACSHDDFPLNDLFNGENLAVAKFRMKENQELVIIGSAFNASIYLWDRKALPFWREIMRESLFIEIEETEFSYYRPSDGKTVDLEIIERANISFLATSSTYFIISGICYYPLSMTRENELQLFQSQGWNLDVLAHGLADSIGWFCQFELQKSQPVIYRSDAGVGISKLDRSAF